MKIEPVPDKRKRLGKKFPKRDEFQHSMKEDRLQDRSKKRKQTRKNRKILRSGISKTLNQTIAKQKIGSKIQIPPDFLVVPTCILLSFETSEIVNLLE